MAYDKVVDSAALDAVFSDIADAIREKAGTSEEIAHTALAEAITNLPSGGAETSVVTFGGGNTFNVCYIDENGEAKHVIDFVGYITVQRGSPIVCKTNTYFAKFNTTGLTKVIIIKDGYLDGNMLYPEYPDGIGIYSVSSSEATVTADED